MISVPSLISPIDSGPQGLVQNRLSRRSREMLHRAGHLSPWFRSFGQWLQRGKDPPMKTQLPVEAAAEGRACKMRLGKHRRLRTRCAARIGSPLSTAVRYVTRSIRNPAPTSQNVAYLMSRALADRRPRRCAAPFFDAFVEPNSGILICAPTFPLYRYSAEGVRSMPLQSENAIPTRRRARQTSQKARGFFSRQSQ